MKRLLFLLTILFTGSILMAQTGSDTPPDSTLTDSIRFKPGFSTPSAWMYVDHMVGDDSFWRSEDEALRGALQRLLDYTLEPFDSTRIFLDQNDFSNIELQKAAPELSERYPLRWLNDSTFLIDPKGWSSNLYLKKEMQVIYPLDTSVVAVTEVDSTGTISVGMDSLHVSPPVPDTIFMTHIDTAALQALEIGLYHMRNDKVTPPMERNGNSGYLNKDQTEVLYFTPGQSWRSVTASPFMDLDNEFQLDSLQFAVDKLLFFTWERDSTLLWINDMYGQRSAFWLNQDHRRTERYWVKNENNDSISLWIGHPARNEISLLLEDDVSFSRMLKEEIDHLPNFVHEPDKSLFSMSLLEAEPVFWNYGFKSAFTLNQTYLSNWTKGGESSFSTMLDVLGEATYNDKEANTQWINMARMQFGTLMTQENGFRKNQDLFEISSKLNRNASGKIGMSSTFYMKNQIARGYSYANDTSIVVSKFLNPATMTIGLGFEYKPVKNTTINVAPISYKNTFVLDTALIDQTKHGIAAGKKTKQEFGMQIVLNNKISPFEDMTIVNNVRLFSSYLNKPQNVDVDWELILDHKINWFFTVRLNLHLIYDDDVKFSVLDSNGDAILLPDGEEKKVAKTQFKEFIGLSLQFTL